MWPISPRPQDCLRPMGPPLRGALGDHGLGGESRGFKQAPRTEKADTACVYPLLASFLRTANCGSLATSATAAGRLRGARNSSVTSKPWRRYRSRLRGEPGVQVGRHPLRVAALEHRLHQRRARRPSPATRAPRRASPGSSGGVGRVPGLHHGQPALRTRERAAEHAQHSRQEHDLVDHAEPPRAGRHPQRAAHHVLRRVAVVRARGARAAASPRTGAARRSTRVSASVRNHRIGGSPSNARASASASRGTSSSVALRTAWPRQRHGGRCYHLLSESFVKVRLRVG